MSLIHSMFNRSGGWLYQLKGIQNANKKWTPTTQWISSHLKSFLQPNDKLVIVGSNSGYLLTSQIFNSEQKCWLLDIDPLASQLFKRRHPGPEYAICTADLLTHKGQMDASGLFLKFLKQIQPDKIIFSNILGQLPVMHPRAFQSNAITNTQEIIMSWLTTGIPTLSFHDRLSAKTHATRLKNQTLSDHWSDEELAMIFYDDTTVVTTHQTDFIGQQARHVDNHIWPLDSASQHVLELVQF